ncbi:recombinase family protein [Marinifilum flexuosum]|uniref:recombinase family protein n=1 Tax=Marinifilum flexuosum TaxID=1117708 RepID=UPI00248F4A47|nr:recombinase family protein [Marinifilum flexuosum]
MKTTNQQTDNKPKAVIYSRVSSLSDRQNYDSQTLELKEAKAMEFDIVGIFEERISGRKELSKRIEFNKMLEFIKENNIKNVLVWEVSRLSRKMQDSVNIIEDWNINGINTYIKNHNLNTLKPDGSIDVQTMLNIHMLQAFSEFELETTRSRVIRGLKASKLKGGANGSIQPYGFKNVDKKLVVEEEEKKIVQLIYKMYLEGNGCQKIAQHLNILEVPTRYAKTFGNKEIKTRTGRVRKGTSYSWTDNTIREIIKNPLYKGERIHKESIIYLSNLGIDPYITVENWEKANEAMKAKANNNGETEFINCMKNKLVCSCGNTMFQHARKNKRDWAYKCLSKRMKYKNLDTEPCNCKGANIDKVNNSVFYLLINLEKATLKNHHTRLKEEYSKNEFEAMKLIKSLEDLEPEKDRLNVMYQKGRISESDYDKEYNSIDSKIVNGKNRLNTISKRQGTLLYNIRYGSSRELGSDPKAFKTDVEHWVNQIKVSSPDIEPYRESYPNKQDFIIRLDVVLMDGSNHEIIFSSRTNTALINGKKVEVEKAINIMPL